MMKSKQLFLGSIYAFLLIACAGDYDQQDVTGNWWGLEHIVDGESQDKSNRIWFGFKADSTYSSVLQGKQKTGTYTVEDNTIMAKPNAERVIPLKIESIRDDILTLHMTNAEQSHTLILTKNN